MVPAGLTHILNIIGSNTFLRIGKSRVLRFHTAVKIRLKRCHTCINPQQRRVVMRDE
ncbi:hypothetical protein D3C71_1035240 [compost metagenome]